MSLPAFRSTTFPAIKEALSSFNSHPSQSFKLIASFPPRDASTKPGNRLCILDSSFNPPTKAHLHIALTALYKYTDPHSEQPSLLLLLATQNADKPSTPASFEDRLAMMYLLSETLSTHHQIDVGITKHARFADKSLALSQEEKLYKGVRQVWLMGYDTITRLMDKKYYPPEYTLKPVYETVLNGENRVMMMIRPDEDKWGSEEEQGRFVEGIEEVVKGKVDVVVGGEEAKGVSSTSVREGFKGEDNSAGEWKEMVTEKVGLWIQERGLYK